MTTDRILIEINCLPSLREALTDWLLERDADAGFTVFDVRGHGANPESLSLAEQVQGSQKRTQFQLESAANEWSSFEQDIRSRFRHADMYIRVLPVVQAVHLSHS